MHRSSVIAWGDMRKGTGFIVILLSLNFLFASETELIVLYSSNTNGLLENCLCPDHAYGALEKRATVIDSLRKRHKNVLLLDAGDLLDIRKNTLLHSYIVRAYEIMKYDAFTCGDQDFVEGTDFFNNLGHNPKLPLVSSNILQGTDILGLKYIIKTFGQLRVGIIGTINPGLYKYLNAEVQKIFNFKEQVPALQAVLEEIKTRCDFIILISHSGYENDLKLAEQFPQIGLIIGGHSQTLLNEVERRGSTYSVQAGENGYRLGILSLQFEEKKPVNLKNKLILLDLGIKNYPPIMELIQSYHQQILKQKHPRN